MNCLRYNFLLLMHSLLNPSTAGRLEQEGGCSEREREGCCVLGGEVCACLYACVCFNLFADLAFKR